MGLSLLITLFFQTALAADLEKKVAVSGQCVVQVTPDRGSVTFVITNLDRDAKIAITKSNALYNQLHSELKKSKIKDLELSTTEYSVQNKVEYENNKNVNKGFEARIALRSTTSDISALGELISLATKIGIKETNSLSTYLSDEKQMIERKKCLEIAAKNAQAKAQILANSLGVKLGKPLQVTEGGANTIPPIPVVAEYARSMKNISSPAIESQTQSLNQSVDIIFLLE